MTAIVNRIRRAGHDLLAAFQTFHRIQFSAPWANPRSR